MGSKTFTQMRTEVQRRVTQLSDPDAGEAVNRAVRWINRQGSYTFQLKDPATLLVPNNGIATTPTDMDVGKAHVIINSNGHPLRRVGVQDVWVASNYNTADGLNYDVYTITQTKLLFYPAIAPGQTVTIIYHAKTADLAGTDLANTPRDFDDLIIDLAEAEERRIYDVGDWGTMLGRAQDQIKVLLSSHISVTWQPMPALESNLVTTEKTQTGRA